LVDTKEEEEESWGKKVKKQQSRRQATRSANSVKRGSLSGLYEHWLVVFLHIRPNFRNYSN
jgi:hypothetical protein